MKTTENQFGKTIVAFHIGRGGIFNNSGFRTFIGEKTIDMFISDLFVGYENQHSILQMVKNNSILSKFYDKISDAIIEENTDLLESFGIQMNDLGERCYFDFNGNIMITESDVNIGIGCLDHDGQYDTTYSKYVDECSDSELELIIKYDYHFEDSYIYAAEKLGIVNEN